LFPCCDDRFRFVPIGSFGIFASERAAKRSTRVDRATAFFQFAPEFVRLVRALVRRMPTRTALRVSAVKIESHWLIDYNAHWAGLRSFVWIRLATRAGML
jgi:hypothetical protein